ncbi:MFS general substrate transporter [Fistulina hepatica ATCC 64428]|uniref:MFS general substrate transporter n=1 Tax=Fistulina hepatica ATCC 64428 TaxID=1128425 RepID=A0A0D7A108_9AGAR|nr:MFS general substrate transporter [Fistulina hepatica ATCC 64428]
MSPANKDFGFLPIPKRLQYDPDKPFKFTLFMNLSFAFSSTFTVANLYYCQPLLIQLSKSFNVSYNEVSNIATLVQSGYAGGLLFISPLGDLVRRRQLILILIFISSGLTIGLSITKNLIVFEVLTFLIGFATVTPQILLPLAADLAPPARRATAISTVLSGLLLGVLVARVLAGVVAQFAPWHVVYYVAVGVQYLILGWSYLILPDDPPKNAHLSYFQILKTMVHFAVTEPVLIQACLITIASSACFASFWVTLTFLLGDSPYNYSTLVIGIWGVVGIVGVLMAPLTGRFVDRLVPWYASLFSIIMSLCFGAIYVAAAGLNISAVVIATIGLDVCRQMLQVSLSTAIFAIEPAARARLNAVSILSLFIGQVMGTSVGTRVFNKHGWRACGALMMGWYGWQLLVLLLRGPHCRRKTWLGFEGGWSTSRGQDEATPRAGSPVEDEKHTEPSSPAVSDKQHGDDTVAAGSTDPTDSRDVEQIGPSANMADVGETKLYPSLNVV